MYWIKKLLKKTPVYWLYKKQRGVRTRMNRYMTLKVIFPRVYEKRKNQPVDERKVIFLEVRNPKLSNNFQLLYRWFEENPNYDVKVHYLLNNLVKRREYDRNCISMLKDLATAKYLFVNEASNALSSVALRPETVVTQTWHGCGAFKNFGFSTAEHIFGLDRKNMLRYPFYKNYTYVTLSSPEIMWAYEEAMGLSDRREVLRPVGVSRTDVFFDEEFIGKAKEHLLQVMPQSEGRKVILYAPTFRGRIAHAKGPDQMDIERFKRELGREYVLLIKHHPLVHNRPPIPDGCEDFVLDVSENVMTIDELLCVSDVCISDYSSLVFEYSLFERPMLFFAYDRAEYDDWRGFYYDYDEMTPGPICMTNDEMLDYIKNLDTRFDKQKVIDFKYKFMRSCDGHATERILRMVLGDGN